MKEKKSECKTTLPSGGHWSFKIRRGVILRCIDQTGEGNLAALFYNPENLFERYNAPDTLKCQHTFKLTKGHFLYSDMGRIFCSIVDDSHGWHETVAGTNTAASIAKRWGKRDYQCDSNDWHQNGYDSFLVELAKYGLGPKDLAANINFFSKTFVGNDGQLQFEHVHGEAGAYVDLRFEMDTLVVLHACPHLMDKRQDYPDNPITLEWYLSDPVLDDDLCKNACAENVRGFENNHLYHLGG